MNAPNFDQTYYTLTWVDFIDKFEVEANVWSNNCYDRGLLKHGLVFSTEAEAQVERDRRNNLLKQQ